MVVSQRQDNDLNPIEEKIIDDLLKAPEHINHTVQTNKFQSFAMDPTWF